MLKKNNIRFVFLCIVYSFLSSLYPVVGSFEVIDGGRRRMVHYHRDEFALSYIIFNGYFKFRVNSGLGHFLSAAGAMGSSLNPRNFACFQTISSEVVQRSVDAIADAWAQRPAGDEQLATIFMFYHERPLALMCQTQPPTQLAIGLMTFITPMHSGYLHDIIWFSVEWAVGAENGEQQDVLSEDEKTALAQRVMFASAGPTPRCRSRSCPV